MDIEAVEETPLEEVDVDDALIEHDSKEVETEAPQEPEEPAEIVPTFGDDEAEDKEKSTVDWVRNLREVNKEKERKIRELESKLKQLEPKVDLGAKPTLASCDYDEDRFEREIEAFNERKLQLTAEDRKRQEQAEKENAAWQARISEYNHSKSKLGLGDYDDAEDIVKSTMTQQQQAVLVQFAKDPAMLVYALGKNPGKARELASTENLIEFALKAKDMESQMKTTTRKPGVQPEKRVEGGGATSGSVNSKLAALEKEAEKTGDRSKVIAFKRSLRK